MEGHRAGTTSPTKLPARRTYLNSGSPKRIGSISTHAPDRPVREMRSRPQLAGGQRAGKRLKCPRCANRFTVSESEASSASTMPGLADAAPMSQFDLERRSSTPEELPIPRSEGDLRDTFNLPLVSGREAEEGSVVAGGGRGVADAAALFQDSGRARKRVTAADARSQARRCMKCGGVVPRGMSICSTCGTDQESGLRRRTRRRPGTTAAARPRGPTVSHHHNWRPLRHCRADPADHGHHPVHPRRLQRRTLRLVGSGGCLRLRHLRLVQFIRGRSAKLLIVALAWRRGRRPRSRCPADRSGHA